MSTSEYEEGDERGEDSLADGTLPPEVELAAEQLEEAPPEYLGLPRVKEMRSTLEVIDRPAPSVPKARDPKVARADARYSVVPMERPPAPGTDSVAAAKATVKPAYHRTYQIMERGGASPAPPVGIGSMEPPGGKRG